MEQSVWTIRDVLAWSVPYLKKGGSESPRLDAELLLCHVMGCRRLDLYLYHDKPLQMDERAAYRDMIKRRALGEPVAYITGARDFFGFNFKVNRHTLIPRPETEHLVEEVLKSYAQGEERRGLDIGTGSGCIAISLKKNRPLWALEAWDVSAAALALASDNAVSLEAEVDFKLCDGLDQRSWANPAIPYDFIVSNPPYIAHEEKAGLQQSVQGFEPHLALFADENGLSFYKTFAGFAASLLKPEGKIFLEIGFKQGNEVSSLLEEYGWREVRILPDLGGRDRVVAAIRPA